MENQVTPKPNDSEDVKLAHLLAASFLEFLSSNGKLTERPDAQILIDALLDVVPGIERESLLVKLFLCYDAGVDKGIQMYENLQANE